uniref:Uncharacterized protein n=1 Tax=Anguilla anguilla TaxID=7936 RepID=A0A0E9VEG5_ANGAN
MFQRNRLLLCAAAPWVTYPVSHVYSFYKLASSLFLILNVLLPTVQGKYHFMCILEYS